MCFAMSWKCSFSLATDSSSPSAIRSGDLSPKFVGCAQICDQMCQSGYRQEIVTIFLPQSAPSRIRLRPMNDGPHILIVDDHREMRDLVSRALAKEGFRVSTAADGKAMRKVLADANIDLILLDLMLPGEDGLSLCRSLRAESDMPIIMLTAKGDEVDRVIGLEMGADDYLPKPFGSRELVARIRAVLRRNRVARAGSRVKTSPSATASSAGPSTSTGANSSAATASRCR